MSDLKKGQVHIWTLSATKRDKNKIAELTNVLGVDELKRANEIKHFQNKLEYQAAHILCRFMLSNFSNYVPSKWCFTKGEHGKPEILRDLNKKKIRFNISHTNGLVACAITRECDIGVDVEWLERSCLFQSIAKKKFSNSEFRYFEKTPPAEKRRIFFSFWTLKESYIKAIGQGLQKSLDSFALNLENLQINFLNEDGHSKKWEFKLTNPTSNHLCALCVAKPNVGSISFNYQALDWSDLKNL